VKTATSHEKGKEKAEAGTFERKKEEIYQVGEVRNELIATRPKRRPFPRGRKTKRSETGAYKISGQNIKIASKDAFVRTGKRRGPQCEVVKKEALAGKNRTSKGRGFPLRRGKGEEQEGSKGEVENAWPKNVLITRLGEAGQNKGLSCSRSERMIPYERKGPGRWGGKTGSVALGICHNQKPWFARGTIQRKKGKKK